MERFLKGNRVDMKVIEALGEVREALTSRLEKAYEVARNYGRVVGSVSRWDKASVDADRAVVTFTIDPSQYYRDIVEGKQDSPLYRTGSVLAIVDPKTLHLVSVRVVSIERPDQLSEARIGVLHYPTGPDPESLVTRTFVRAELLLEWDPKSGDAVPANLSIEPQSPVLDPEARYIPALLGLPREGLILGSLANNGVPVKGGAVPVRLPWNALLQHVLVLGTTGSGKTTLLKNMIAYTVYSGGGVPVVMDLNRDYVQLLYPRLTSPSRSTREWMVDNGVYKGVAEPDAMVLMVPIPRRLWIDALDRFSWSLPEALLDLFNMYYEDVIAPVADATGIGGIVGDPVVHVEDGLARVVARQKAPGRMKTLVFVPYAIRSSTVSSQVMFSLMPGLTENARELLRRLFEHRSDRFFLDLLVSLLDAYLGLGRDKGSQRELLYEAISALDDKLGGLTGEKRVFAEAYTGELEVLGQALFYSYQHDETVKNLVRNLQALLGTGLIDVPVGVGDGLLFLGEPGWGRLVGMAEALRAPVVVDLSWAESSGGAEGPVHRVAAIRMLYSLLGWRQREWSRRRRGSRILVFMDEAHQYFPRERIESAARQVASTVSRLARLGRARGIGLVFATHSPGDLNDIVFQLANTKVLMRMEVGQLERLDVPSGYRHFLALAPPRSFVVRSYVYPEGLVSGITSYPLTSHYDLSAL